MNQLNFRTLSVLVGVILLAALVWFFGALISIGSFQPLANKNVRLCVAIGIILFWVVKFAIRQYRSAKRNAILVDKMESDQEPMLKNLTENSEMSRQFMEIDSVLRKHKFSKDTPSLLERFSNGQYLYQMPWYVVIGAAGSGKTSALKQSGLNFPLESTFGSSITGLAGTRDCDWFLSEEAILLDTAGRLSLHDARNEQDAYDWKEFLGLLKKYRPKQPINGVIVTVSVEDLLNSDVNIKQLAYELRKRINEMSIDFKINFPVYLMITKLDMLKGFNEFFKNLTDDQRRKSLGFELSDTSLSENSDIVIGYVLKKLNSMQDNINATMINVLSKLNELEDKNSAFSFSSEFSTISSHLVELFRELYKHSKFEEKISWRGIYFSSAKQEGQILDPVLSGLGNELGLRHRYIDQEKVTNNTQKSFFLQDFFEDRVFKDLELASENKQWSKRNNFIYMASLVGIGVLTTSIIIAMFNSYSNNKDYLTYISGKSTDLKEKSQEVANKDDFLQHIQFANQIKELASSPKIATLNNPPISYQFGMYQAEDMQALVDDTYQRVLQENVMPLVSFEIYNILKQSSSRINSLESYNALKAYIMMFDKKYYDNNFIMNFMNQHFMLKHQQNDIQQQQQITKALEYLLSQQVLTPNIPYDANLVENKRMELAGVDMNSLILDAVYLNFDNEKITPVSIETMAGKQTKLVFYRDGGKPAIDPIYTKQAYKEYILENLLIHSITFNQEEKWVLGEYASIQLSEMERLKEVQNLYLERYEQTWKNYIDSIKLRQPKSTKEAVDMAKILSDQNSSPLANLIKGISENTKLNVAINQENKDDINNFVKGLMDRAGIGKLTSGENLQKYYSNLLEQNTKVDDAFAEYHNLTKKAEDQQTTIYSIIASIKDLYEYLDILNTAIEKGVDLPPNDSLFKYRAEINRLPTHFKKMFEQFSTFILDSSLSEQDQRTRIAEEKALQEKLKQEEKIQQEKLEQEEKIKQEKIEQEEKALAQANELKLQQENLLKNSLEHQFANINKECEGLVKKYPFVKTAKQEINLADFTQIFGKKNGYMAFQTLSPEMARLAQATTLNELYERDNFYTEKFSKISNAEMITKAYFTENSSTPLVNFSIKVKSLDKNVDTVVIQYAGTQKKYSHGPIIPINMTWPPKGEDTTASIALYSESNELGRISSDGLWSIFRLIDVSDNPKWQAETVTLPYTIDKKKVVLELVITGSKNTFNMSLLRNFQCP